MFPSKPTGLDALLVTHACHNDANVGPSMGCMLGGDRNYKCMTSEMLSRDVQQGRSVGMLSRDAQWGRSVGMLSRDAQ